MDISADQYKDAARKAAADGDVEAARSLIARAKEAENAQKSFGTKLKENVFGDDDDTTQNFGEKVGTFLNKGGESMTFGLVGDEASAAVAHAIPGGQDYTQRRDFERQQEALLEKTNPGAALTADIGGALIAPVGGVGALAKAPGIANLLMRAGTSGAATAGMAGTYGFAEGEGGAGERLKDARGDAMLGGAMGAAIPVVGAGVQKIANNRATKQMMKALLKKAETTESLKAAGQGAYQAIDDAGVQIKPSVFSKARENIVDSLRKNTGYDELPGAGSLTPNSARTMQIMDKASEKMAGSADNPALPFSSLDQMRRQAGAAAGNVANKTDQKAGMTIINGIDDVVKNLGADDVVAGDVEALQRLIPKAREIWGKMSRSQLLDDAIEIGEQGYMGGAGSGVRRQFKLILKNKKLRKQFSDAELKVLNKVVHGSIPEQLLHLAGGGMGRIMGATAGAGVGGLPGMLGAAALGSGARKLSESVASKNAEVARKLISTGGMRAPIQSSETPRKLIEQLLRQGGAAALQR